MITVTVTELRKNLKHYMLLSNEEDVYVTSGGKVLTVLTSPVAKDLEVVESLFGCIPAVDDETIEKMKMERLRLK